jgi:SHS2 domain-containing protein
VKPFEFLEHTADVYISAHGKTLEEAYANAALALFETMTDTSRIDEKQVDFFEFEGVDQVDLLYCWLETLIVNFDVKLKLYSRFNVDPIEETSTGYFARAKAWGEKFDENRHPSRVGVKAVTYHQMEIMDRDGTVTVRFILDI